MHYEESDIYKQSCQRKCMLSRRKGLSGIKNECLLFTSFIAQLHYSTLKEIGFGVVTYH